jgi:hypothetical protein
LREIGEAEAEISHAKQARYSYLQIIERVFNYYRVVVLVWCMCPVIFLEEK